MQRIKRLFDFRFILSTGLLVPWIFIKKVTNSFETIHEAENVDIEPRPIIGRAKLQVIWHDLIDKQVYPSLNGEVITLTFIVYKDGEISNIHSSVINKELAEKITMLFRSLNIKWIPGIYKTEVVNIKVKLKLSL